MQWYIYVCVFTLRLRQIINRLHYVQNIVCILYELFVVHALTWFLCTKINQITQSAPVCRREEFPVYAVQMYLCDLICVVFAQKESGNVLAGKRYLNIAQKTHTFRISIFEGLQLQIGWGIHSIIIVQNIYITVSASLCHFHNFRMLICTNHLNDYQIMNLINEIVYGSIKIRNENHLKFIASKKHYEMFPSWLSHP